jgi:basic amino acid/polyamine antiporter, APA family
MTPVPATLLAGALVGVLALFLPLVLLAQITSYITLVMYALMNLSLLLVKRRAPRISGIEVPMWVPVSGMLLSLGLLLAQLYFSLNA